MYASSEHCHSIIGNIMYTTINSELVSLFNIILCTLLRQTKKSKDEKYSEFIDQRTITLYIEKDVLLHIPSVARFRIFITTIVVALRLSAPFFARTAVHRLSPQCSELVTRRCASLSHVRTSNSLRRRERVIALRLQRAIFRR